MQNVFLFKCVKCIRTVYSNMNEIMNESDNIFQQLRAGDVIVVDRGFRDSIHILRDRGLIVKVPKGSDNKLTRIDANESCFATKTRYVIEVRNSHIKKVEIFE